MSRMLGSACGASIIGVERYENTESKEKLVMRTEGKPAARAASLQGKHWVSVVIIDRRHIPAQERSVAQNASRFYFQQPVFLSFQQKVLLTQELLEHLNAFSSVDAVSMETFSTTFLVNAQDSR